MGNRSSTISRSLNTAEKRTWSLASTARSKRASRPDGGKDSPEQPEIASGTASRTSGLSWLANSRTIGSVL